MKVYRHLCMILFLLLFFVPSVHADTNVSGKYGGGGSKVTIKLSVASPPPAAFIVLQQLPTGVQLVGASPQPAGVSGQQVKWFIKHPNAGGSSISMQLSQSVSTKQLRGQIRFKHPRTGKMLTGRIQ